MRSFLRPIALAAALLALCAAPPVSAQTRPVLVFAAASLKNALDEASVEWTHQTGKTATIAYGASSTLAKQIEAGAPADLFISADTDWMDYLAQKDLIQTASRCNLLGNKLVLIAPKGTAHVAIAANFPLAALLQGGRLAVADTDAVPAGKYAKTALLSLGIWPAVEHSLAPAVSVRAALLLVARGEAPYGIVYATDAAAEPGVTIVGVFPDDSHAPIVYPAAILAGSGNADAAGFLAFLESPKAMPFFEKQGFAILPR